MLCLEKVGNRSLQCRMSLTENTDERDERLDNESERASLVSSTLPTNQGAIRPRPKHTNNPSGQGILGRLMGRTDNRAAYEPINDAEE